MCAIDPAQDLNGQDRFHAQNLERSNSLFRNILPLTPLESRFCAAPPTPEPRNSNQSNILQVRAEKRTHQSDRANSLFGNILPVKYLESIFCEPHRHLAIVTTRKKGFCQINPKKLWRGYIRLELVGSWKRLTANHNWLRSLICR